MSSDRKRPINSADELTTVLSLECVGTIQRLHWVQKRSLRKVAKHTEILARPALTGKPGRDADRREDVGACGGC